MFGKWEVQNYSHFQNEHYWSVLCTGCGTLHNRRASQLVLGRTSGCHHCNSVEREKYNFWEGIDGVSKQYHSRLRFRNKEVTVTLQELADIWKKQKGICALSGVKLTLAEKDTEWNKATASIDRINSDHGYHSWNIQWVHKQINTMKSNLTDGAFVDWCRTVVEYIDRERY